MFDSLEQLLEPDVRPQTELDDDEESRRPLNWGDGAIPLSDLPNRGQLTQRHVIKFRTAAAALGVAKPKIKRQRSATAKRLPLQEAMKNGNSETFFYRFWHSGQLCCQ